MLTRYQYLLTKLAEEASEIAQIALKTQQFGADEICPNQPDTDTNTERIHKELSDLLYVVDMLNEEFDFGYSFGLFADEPCGDNPKKEKVNKYYQYSARLGFVEDYFNGEVD